MGVLYSLVMLMMKIIIYIDLYEIMFIMLDYYPVGKEHQQNNA